MLLVARLENVHDAEALSRLRGPWEALCAELGDAVTVFASFAWHEAWWRHYGAGALLHVVAMWEDHRLVGIAPLMVRRATVHGLPVTVVGFMENGQSLHNDFLVLPAFRERFLRELLRTLEEASSTWDVIVFRNLPDDSANRETLAGLLVESGRTWRRSPTWYDSPYLIPAGSWEEYLAGRSTRTRKRLRTVQNGLSRAGVVSVRQIRTAEEFLAARDELFAVARQSWAEQGGDSLASPANGAFYTDLALGAADRGWLSIWVLELNGEMIAVEFHLRAFGREHALRGHYRPDQAPLSPGAYLEMQILKHIFTETERVRLYDFCGSFDAYKGKWTDAAVSHSDVTVFGNRVYGRLLAFHELTTVPLLQRIAPRGFWNGLGKRLGISTRRLGTD